MGFAVAVDLDVQTRAQRVDDGRADAVQAAAGLIGVIVKLTACMQGRENQTLRTDSFFMHPDRDTASVILHRDGIVRIDRHFNIFTISGKRLINCIIYNLINQMMKSSRRCTSNVHSGSFSDCLKSL